MPVPSAFKEPLSLELIAKYIWDLKSIPRQRTFELLSLNCVDQLEKEKLIEFTTAEGLEEMYNYTCRPKRTILEVLIDFPSAVSSLTIPILFELFSTIKPRSFSIASNKQLGRLEILVAIVEYSTILKKKRQGLCSNWLKKLHRNDMIFATIKQGTMNIPTDPKIPIIMVGPGTGVAPFRSIMLEREFNENSSSHANNVLFFGCRNKDMDFHFRNDFMRLQKNGVVTCFFAFSRDQSEKRYVQHLIEEQQDFLKPLILQQNTFILVAGNAKNMPEAVRNAFNKILNNNDIIENLIKTGRYQEETWS